MTQQQPEVQVKDIDHLGIIAGLIDQIGWVEAVNELVGTHSLEQEYKDQQSNERGFRFFP